MLAGVWIVSLFYWLLALLVIFPPDEAVSAGLTIESLLSSWLQSETLAFTDYQMKRTVATLLSHTLILPGYVLTLHSSFPEISTHYQQTDPYTWYSVWFVSLLPFIFAALLTRYWTQNKWSNHPLATELQKYAREGDQYGWKGKTAEINMEFRMIDKFSTRLNNVSRVVATESWLLKISPYWLHVFPLRDAILVLESSQTVSSTVETSAAGQILTIRASSIKAGVKPYTFRVNSFHWAELERKLINPIVNTREISIHKSLADRFYPEFERVVSLNPTMTYEAEIQKCIGCMANSSNVMLSRRCLDDPSTSSCRPCSCRPMWCLSCLSTWFAARQDQNETETWLSSTAPCPTCRSTFCMLDVCLIATS